MDGICGHSDMELCQHCWVQRAAIHMTDIKVMIITSELNTILSLFGVCQGNQHVLNAEAQAKATNINIVTPDTLSKCKCVSYLAWAAAILLCARTCHEQFYSI